MTDAVFQTAAGLNAVNTGSTYSASLAWNDSTSAIEASIEAIAHTWDGGASDGQWKSANNWDLNELPTAGDSVTINNATVNHNGTTGQFLAGNLNVSLVDSTLNGESVFRLNGATINVDSTSALTGGFWDLNNATLNFQDGAQFTANNWEQKGTNVFDFELSSTGFTALTPTNFANSGSPTTTYTADLASYSGATQDVTLVDFTNSALDNATFTGGGQYTLSIENTGSNAARLYYDDATEAVKLSINETVTWTGGDGDGKLSTAANWDTPDGKAPIANDNLLINNGDTVAHGGKTCPAMPPLTWWVPSSLLTEASFV